MPLILPNNIANDQDADGDLLQQNFATIEDWANQEAISRDGSTGMTGALLLPGPPTQPNQAATKGYVDSSTLIGEVKMWSGDAEPAGWMFCRGQAVSRATYATLFGVIGIKFGAGDGSTTFLLPDMAGRLPVGVWSGGDYAGAVGQVGGNEDATVPSHSHTAGTGAADRDHTHSVDIWSGYTDVTHLHLLRGSNDASSGGGFGEFNVADAGNTGFAGVGHTMPEDRSLNHRHAVNGNTGGFSTNHYHAVTVNAAGVDGHNMNLPPFTTFNFIIKVS